VTMIQIHEHPADVEAQEHPHHSVGQGQQLDFVSDVVGCCIIFLIAYESRGVGEDDQPKAA
jgi:hypothetical protein